MKNTKYEFSYCVELGDSFFDAKTTASIEVLAYRSNDRADVQVTRPESPSGFYKDIVAGSSWLFKYNQQEYCLKVEKIDSRAESMVALVKSL